MGRTQQVAWRDLGSGFGQQQMLGKGTDDLQAPGPVEAMSRLGPTSPVQGQSGGQRPPVTQRISVTGELQKAEPFVLELETQRSAVGQIRAHLGKHGPFHRWLLGQGSATSRSLLQIHVRVALGGLQGSVAEQIGNQLETGPPAVGPGRPSVP